MRSWGADAWVSDKNAPEGVGLHLVMIPDWYELFFQGR